MSHITRTVVRSEELGLQKIWSVSGQHTYLDDTNE